MKVGIVAKLVNEEAIVESANVLHWFLDRGKEVFVEENLHSLLKKKIEKSFPKLSLKEFSTKVDLLVILGGDGTLISVSHYPSENPPLIIGVNMGTLGFLTEVKLEKLFEFLEEVLSGRYIERKRSLLKIELYDSDNSLVNQFHALNDAVLTKGALARIFGVEVLIGGEKVALIRGDGVIVSSPTGSTGYSLSAGGSIVHPQVDALLLTPICPHSLMSRPLIIPGDLKVELCIDDKETGDDSEIYCTIDGQAGYSMVVGSRVIVSKSDKKVRFACSHSSYFDVLGAKLKWLSA